MDIFCSVATLGSWRTTAGGGRALQSGAKSEAISPWSLKHLRLLLLVLESFRVVGVGVGVKGVSEEGSKQKWRIIYVFTIQYISMLHMTPV